MEDLSKFSDDELMAIAGVQKQQQPSKLKTSQDYTNEELFKIAGVEPTEKNLGLNTMAKKILPTFMTGAEPLPGERTLLGNVFERPGAAVRESIRGGLKGGFKGAVEGYVKGSNLPEQSKTFVQQSQETPIKTTMTGGKGDKGEAIKSGAIGLGRDILAYGVDTLTNPADVLLTLFTAGTSKAKDLTKAKNVIDQAFEKAVRPSVSMRKTASETKKARDNVRLAVDSIIDNNKAISYIDESGEVIKGGLPKNLDQFSQALDKTKKDIFESYTELKRIAGQENRVVFVDDIAKELRKSVDKTAMKDFSPEVVKSANALADTLSKRGFYSVDEANDVLENLNQQLKAFYRNPDPKMVHSNSLNALVANNLRKKLDNVINEETLENVSNDINKTFSSLKRRYGALKSIEGDLNKRLVVDARKNMKGLIDFSDIFTAQQMAEGILFTNPTSLTRGAVGMAAKKAIKAANDPNRIIKNMFIRSERIKKGIATTGQQIKKVTPLATRTVERISENQREKINR